MLRKTKEKLYPKVLDNYRGSRDMNLGQTQNLRHSREKSLHPIEIKITASPRLSMVENFEYSQETNEEKVL